MKINVRKGTKNDVPDLLKLIKQLATFEKEPNAVVVTEQELLKDGFGSDKIFEFWVAEHSEQIVGIALTYIRYSTWKGKSLYLEDIIVDENFRNQKIGTALIDEVFNHAKQNGYRKVDWQVLDWNTNAINFYKKYNAQLDSGWINCYLTEKQIKNYGE